MALLGNYSNYYTHYTYILILFLPEQRWELGIGQRYIKYLATGLSRGELHSSNHAARIENFRNIRTFDGNAYTIPGTRVLST